MVLACNESCEVSGTIVGIGIGKNYGNITNLKDDVRIQFSPPSVNFKTLSGWFCDYRRWDYCGSFVNVGLVNFVSSIWSQF